MIKKGGKTNKVDYDESNIQQTPRHTIADNISSSRPIIQKELEIELSKLPSLLALTKLQSEKIVYKEEEDKSEVS